MPQETLVMLPGMMCDYRLFEPQISALEKNHEILVPTLDASGSIEDLEHRAII